MPRFVLSDPEVETLVDFLTAQRAADLSSAPVGDPGSGERLFLDHECGDCHTRAGQGSDDPLSLSGLGHRVNRPWLVAYLQDPERLTPGTGMPAVGLSAHQAADLAAYLLGPVVVDTEQQRPDADAVEVGLSLFVARGCSGCHRIGRYVKPFDSRSLVNVSAAVRHHETPRSDSPEIRLSASRYQALERALPAGWPAKRQVDAETFLSAFWGSPTTLNGAAPAPYDPEAGDLGASDCAACHTSQHEDWSGSLHRRAMGPGVVGQFHDTQWHAPAFAHSCQQCHGVAGEQHAALPDGAGGFEVNYRFDPSLYREGITCINCHVRRHVRFGPPPGERSPAAVWRGVGHAGGVASPVFGSASFCSGCHQFDRGDRRINGKLLQDTYSQWAASPQAGDGQSCQDCHMPGRRHLWRGIHHAPTVREAVDLRLSPSQAAPGSTAVAVRLDNVGAGHHLPTYVTPKLFVKVQRVGPGVGDRGSKEETRAVGWEVELDAGGEELYDTRIPAGGTWVWRYSTSGPAAEGDSLKVTVEVHPDHFYLRFFENYDRAGLSPAAKAMIDSAESQARVTPYVLFETTMPLADAGD